jgi:uncharacterized protein (TIGR04255 family)
MSTQWKADDLVLTRSENTDRFKRNFLRQAVCELRFPTLMELGEQRPPSSFVKALRKDYPHLELNNEFTLGLGASNTGSSNVHIFRSAKLNWSVTLKQSALTIETTSYSGFEGLRERILKIIEAAEPVIDSDFFTRIGLRYINVVNSGDEDVTDWINPALTSTITSKAFAGVSDFSGRIQIGAEDGGCIFQHAITFPQTATGTLAKPDFLLDIDTFRSEIAISDAIGAVDIMHRQAFDIFDWSLSDRARSYLSEDSVARKGAN